MFTDYLPHVIGGAQLLLLLGIYKKLGSIEQRQSDHEREDDRRFLALKGEITCLQHSSPSSPR